nr:MAG: putative capsid protein [Arizlama virus]
MARAARATCQLAMAYKKKRGFRRYKRRATYSKKRYLKRKTSYKRKRSSVFKNPYNGGYRTNYVKYVAQYTYPLEIIVPAETKLPDNNPDRSQAQLIYTYRLDTLANVDPIVANYNKMYRSFRMKTAWVELTPKFNISDNTGGNSVGEVWFIPLHETETLYRSGMSNVAFGAAFPAQTIQDVDHWRGLKGAKCFRFTRPGQKLRMRIALTNFRQDVANPQVGVATTQYIEEYTTKAGWKPVTSWAGVATGVINQVIHYGFLIVFNGWRTDESHGFNFQLRAWIGLEYKDYLANVGGTVGVSALEPHQEDPWDDEKGMSEAETEIVDPPYPPTLTKQLSKVSLAPFAEQAKPANAFTSLKRPATRV